MSEHELDHGRDEVTIVLTHNEITDQRPQPSSNSLTGSSKAAGISSQNTRPGASRLGSRSAMTSISFRCFDAASSLISVGKCEYRNLPLYDIDSHQNGHKSCAADLSVVKRLMTRPW